MTVTVKNKTPLVVPDQIRRRAGFKSGDELEFKVSAGVVTIHPKAAVARDDYTLAERAPSTAASPRAKRSTARVAPTGLSTPRRIYRRAASGIRQAARRENQARAGMRGISTLRRIS